MRVSLGAWRRSRSVAGTAIGRRARTASLRSGLVSRGRRARARQRDAPSRARSTAESLADIASLTRAGLPRAAGAGRGGHLDGGCGASAGATLAVKRRETNHASPPAPGRRLSSLDRFAPSRARSPVNRVDRRALSRETWLPRRREARRPTLISRAKAAVPNQPTPPRRTLRRGRRRWSSNAAATATLSRRQLGSANAQSRGWHEPKRTP